MLDERQATPVSIMEKFAEQLRLTGKFERALKLYRETSRRMQTERQVNEELTRSGDPGVSKALGLLEHGSKGVGDVVWNETQYNLLLKNAEQLENPLNNLTSAFISELNTLAERQVVLSTGRVRRNQRILLFFDTFEQIALMAAPWLLDYFLVQDININIVLIVAGRNNLEHSVPDPRQWLPYYNEHNIYFMQLDTFTQEETMTYLMELGITDPISFDPIWELSRGLPLYLSLLTSNPQEKVDPTANVVDNFLRWIPEQEPIKRRLALDGALFSKPFNQDDLQALPYLPQSNDERSALFTWLINLPFVLVDPYDGRYFYHELVRRMFSRHLFQKSPNKYYSTRKAIAEYYRRVLEKTQIQREQTSLFSDEWIVLVFALAQQLFALPDETDHVKAIEYVLYAFEHGKNSADVKSNLHALSQELLGPGINIQRNTERILEELSAYIETDLPSQPEDVVIAANNLLHSAARQPSFSAIAQASILCRRGIAYQNLGEYQRALEDFNQMINLDPDTADYYNYRGNAYYEIKDYHRAIIDFQQALQLDPNLASAYRGLILAQQQR